MTDVQLPFHHQKGMNGKYIGKNSLEIRGGGVASLNNTNDMTNKSTNQTNQGRKQHQAGQNHAANSNINHAKPAAANIQLIKMSGANSSNVENLSLVASVNFIESRTRGSNKTTSASLSSTGPGVKHRVSNFNHQLENDSMTNFAVENNNQLTSRSNQSVVDSSNNLNLISQSNNEIANLLLDGNLKSMNNNVAGPNHNSNSHQLWHDESNSGWTGTGVMSDRSSVYSIDDGDFDKEASRKVNHQLKEIEAVLYEQNSTHSSNLNEYKEWLEKFPHLRILGKSLQQQKDDFNSFRLSLSGSLMHQISSSSSLLSPIQDKTDQQTSIKQINLDSSDANGANQIDLSSLSSKYLKKRENTDLNHQGLYLNGMGMPIKKLSEKELEQKRPEYCFLEEEIFEQDGVYEELLAYDNQEEEYLVEHNKRLNLNKRRRHGLPPITPKAAMRDLVSNFVFDNMWSELIDWCAELIKTYSRTILDREFNSESTCKTPQPGGNGASLQNQPSLDYPSTPTQLKNPHVSSHSSATTTKSASNIIQLKPFDPANEPSAKAAHYSTNSSIPGLISRDNSSLYAPSSKLVSSDMITGGQNDHSLMEIDNLLRIKQLNPINPNSSSALTSNLKHLNPVVNSQSRVNSANRRPHQLNKDYRKRYSSSEMDKWEKSDNKNIIIHGLGVSRPTPINSTLNTLNEFNNRNSAIYTPAPGNTDETGAENEQPNDVNYRQHDSRPPPVPSASYSLEPAMIDEINLITTNNNSQNNNNKVYYYSTFNYYNNHTLYHHYNGSNHMLPMLNNNSNSGSGNLNQPLPRIENSFQARPLNGSSKPIRISSANNLKPIKERNERPLTSTATRYEGGGGSSISLINKRSTTPSGLIYSNSRSTNFTPSMKVSGVRFSSDDSTLTNANLNSFLSTKSFTLINNNNGGGGSSSSPTNNNNNNTSSSLGLVGASSSSPLGTISHTTRRNSIKEIHTRAHK